VKISLVVLIFGCIVTGMAFLVSNLYCRRSIFEAAIAGALVGQSSSGRILEILAVILTNMDELPKDASGRVVATELNNRSPGSAVMLDLSEEFLSG
jgi:hypothetical protein